MVMAVRDEGHRDPDESLPAGDAVTEIGSFDAAVTEIAKATNTVFLIPSSSGCDRFPTAA
jgi:hypothetical protein